MGAHRYHPTARVRPRIRSGVSTSSGSCRGLRMRQKRRRISQRPRSLDGETRESWSVGEASSERRLHVDAENVSRNVAVKRARKRCPLIKSGVTATFSGASPIMDYRVSYEHSLASAPDDYIAKVPSQVVEGGPANIPAPLVPGSLH